MRGGDPEQAYNRALRILRYRACSADEIRKKLGQGGYSRTIVETTLRKLASLSLINDESFARNWATSRVEQRGYGPLRVARELQEKGITPSIVGQILRETFGNNAAVAEKAEIILAKRFRGQNLADPNVLRRAAAFLQRRGYPSAVIIDLLGQERVED